MVCVVFCVCVCMCNFLWFVGGFFCFVLFCFVLFLFFPCDYNVNHKGHGEKQRLHKPSSFYHENNCKLVSGNVELDGFKKRLHSYWKSYRFENLWVCTLPKQPHARFQFPPRSSSQKIMSRWAALTRLVPETWLLYCSVDHMLGMIHSNRRGSGLEDSWIWDPQSFDH